MFKNRIQISRLSGVDGLVYTGHWARILLGWVTAHGQVNCLGM